MIEMITVKQLASAMEQTVLRPETTDAILKECCQIAKSWDIAALCVRPCDIVEAKRLLHGSDVKTCATIAFPHGGAKTNIKVAAAADALEDGADEIELMPNIGSLTSGNFTEFERDIKAVSLVTYRQNKPLRVILETCYLSKQLIAEGCRICLSAGADYVVTSTGYGIAGANAEDVALMKATLADENVKIKASGGIKTLDSALEMLGAGGSRIGTGFVKTILEEASARQREGVLDIVRR